MSLAPGSAGASIAAAGARGLQDRKRPQPQTRRCITICVYMHKGGVGKSTHVTLLGAALAKAGHRVALIDADPQLSLSIQWVDDHIAQTEARKPGVGTPLKSGRGGRGSEPEGEGAEGSEDAGNGYCMPAIEGDPRPKLESDALHPDVMRDAFNTLAQGDNLYTSLRKIGLHNDRSHVPELHVCNNDDYEGNLCMLPSSADLFRYNDSLVANERSPDLAGRVFGAFGELMRRMEEKYDLDYIIVDVGPHTDTLHKVIVTSCNFVQLVVDPSMAAFASTYSLLTGTLPNWIQWHKAFNPVCDADDEAFRFNPDFPLMLPVLGLKHVEEFDKESGLLTGCCEWSASNLYISMRDTLDHDNVPAEVKRLYQPCADGAGGRTMLIPFLKNLSFLAVAQETGRAFIHLEDEHIEDYYVECAEELDRKAIRKEVNYASARYKSLVRSLEALHAHTVAVRVRKEKGRPPPRGQTVVPPPRGQTFAPPPRGQTFAPPPRGQTVAPPPQASRPNKRSRKGNPQQGAKS